MGDDFVGPAGKQRRCAHGLAIRKGGEIDAWVSGGPGANKQRDISGGGGWANGNCYGNGRSVGHACSCEGQGSCRWGKRDRVPIVDEVRGVDRSQARRSIVSCRGAIARQNAKLVSG